jgi:hypothetical protein
MLALDELSVGLVSGLAASTLIFEETMLLLTPAVRNSNPSANPKRRAISLP